jgi:hypothetical protein
MTKVTYPEVKNSEGYFQCGKFYLGELLDAIPVVGSILKTRYHLITGLSGDNSASGVHPEAYRTRVPRGRPSLSRQIHYEPKEEEYE